MNLFSTIQCKALPVILVSFGLSLLGCSSTQAAQHALLIGVGDYKNSFGKDFADLDGPAYDIESMRKVVQEQMDVRPENLRVLLDKDATKQAIVSEVERLASTAKRGDSVFIYFSGHGTSSKWVDDSSQLSIVNMPDGTGALVPYDFDPVTSKGELRSPDELAAQLVIGRRDLRPLLEEMDQQDIHTWVVVDACYSGNAVRGRFNLKPSPTRHIALGRLGKQKRHRTRSVGDTACRNCDGRKSVSGYPYENIVFFSAASEAELAKDMDGIETHDGVPHGAFTDSLLRVLAEKPVSEFNYKSLFASVENTMKAHCNCQHSPNLLPRKRSPKSLSLNQSVMMTDDSGSDIDAEIQPSDREFRVSFSGDANKLKAAAGKAGISVTDDNALVQLNVINGNLVATDKNSDLINEWRGIPDVSLIEDWLRTRYWLHQRVNADNSIGSNVALSLRDGITGNGAEEGSEVYLSVWLEKEARVLILDMFGDGEMIVLYPENQSEMKKLPRSRQVVIPADSGASTDLDAVKPIKVGAPFGKDTILLYAFSDDTAETNELLQQALSAGSPRRDSGFIEKLERRLTRPGVSAASLELITYPREN